MGAERLNELLNSFNEHANSVKNGLRSVRFGGTW